jgi:hypothetical protein
LLDEREVYALERRVVSELRCLAGAAAAAAAPAMGATAMVAAAAAAATAAAAAAARGRVISATAAAAAAAANAAATSTVPTSVRATLTAASLTRGVPRAERLRRHKPTSATPPAASQTRDPTTSRDGRRRTTKGGGQPRRWTAAARSTTAVAAVAAVVVLVAVAATALAAVSEVTLATSATLLTPIDGHLRGGRLEDATGAATAPLPAVPSASIVHIHRRIFGLGARPAATVAAAAARAATAATATVLGRHAHITAAAALDTILGATDLDVAAERIGGSALALLISAIAAVGWAQAGAKARYGSGGRRRRRRQVGDLHGRVFALVTSRRILSGSLAERAAVSYSRRRRTRLPRCIGSGRRWWRWRTQQS